MNDDDALQAMKERHEQVILPIAKGIIERDSSIPSITALIMAQDEASKTLAWERLPEIGWLAASRFVGSYSRMDFIMEVLDEGVAPRSEIYSHLPGLWVGSDPNDQDPRFLALWTDAWQANGRETIIDGRPLPHGPVFKVWRGQDEGTTQGISWTLDPLVAERFARGAALRQSDREGTIFYGTVMRRHVLAYLSRRGEEEIIVDPASVR